ncbi:MAG: rod-binding protein [Pirellulales bacterium]
MNISPLSSNNGFSNAQRSLDGSEKTLRQGQSLEANGSEDPLRDAFRDFVGQTFFGQMIASLRSTQQEPAYFHGGQAEKIFQSQYDQQLAETIADKSASKVADPMYDLFQLKRR